MNRVDVEATIDALQAEADRLLAACSRQQDEIQQILGKALGYPLGPGETEGGSVCVGDHVAESLASEAASTIAALQAEREELRKSLAWAMKWVDTVTLREPDEMYAKAKKLLKEKP